MLVESRFHSPMLMYRSTHQATVVKMTQGCGAKGAS